MIAAKTIRRNWSQKKDTATVKLFITLAITVSCLDKNKATTPNTQQIKNCCDTWMSTRHTHTNTHTPDFKYDAIKLVTHVVNDYDLHSGVIGVEKTYLVMHTLWVFLL